MSEPEARVSAVLFDMDGVLIDSRSVIEQAWREAARMFQRQISEEQIHAHIHGQPGPHTIRALFSDLSSADQERVQAHVMHVENTADYDPIPGVAQLIARLGRADIALGIVTSGWQYKIDRVIELLNAGALFSVIVHREHVARGKPHPDPYLLAAKRLGLPAAKTLVFEDAVSGVVSAVAADAYCVGIGGEDLVCYGAKIAIPDFRDVSLGDQRDGVTLSCGTGHELSVDRLRVTPPL